MKVVLCRRWSSKIDEGVKMAKIAINPIACDGHGMCAELLPELIHLDDWGYPIIISSEIPKELLEHARRAERVCPTLALIVRAN